MSKPVSQADWQKIVERTAARNGAIELRPDPEAHGATSWEGAAARGRLLRVEASGWLVEDPANDPKHRLAPGMNLLGVLNAGTHRIGFRTTVLAREATDLNPRQRLAALRLSEPTDMYSAQRRGYYRVATQALDVPPVWLWALPDPPKALGEIEREIQAAHRPGSELDLNLESIRPRVGAFLAGKLHDVSGSGLALTFEPRQLLALKDAGRLWVEFYLPGFRSPIAVAAKPVRLVKRTNVAVLLGLAFSSLHSETYQEFLADTICQFAAEQQRRRTHNKRV